jgi:hypothetical protein
MPHDKTDPGVAASGMKSAEAAPERQPATSLPGVFVSRPAAALLAVSIALTLAVYLWAYKMRSGIAVPDVAPIFHFLFVRFDFFGAMCGVLLLIAAAFVPARFPAARVLEWIGNRPLQVAIVVTLACAMGTVFVYHDLRLSMDEYSPYFQSQAFAAGHLAGRFPTDILDALVPPPFQNQFLAVSHVTGEVASKYWPSFALLLTPFTWLGIAWACNALITGLTVLAVHRIALRLFADRATAGLAVLLTVASPVILANGITYYSMPAHLLASAAFALLLMDPTPRRLLLAGLVGSIALTLHNPFPHFLFALPWIAWLCFQPHAVRNLGCLALGYLPLSALLGVGWHLYVAALSQAGVQAPPPGPTQFFFGFTLPDLNIVLARIMGMAKVVTWAVPVLLPLAVVGAWKARKDRFILLFAASGLTTFAGYLFVVFDSGHGWGFRYFHSAWLCLPLLAVAAMPHLATASASAAGDDAPENPVRRFVVACASLTLCIGLPLRAAQMHEFTAYHIDQLPQPLPDGPRVVIVDPTYSFYGLDLVQNDPFLRGDEIRLLTFSPETNVALVRRLRPTFEQSLLSMRGEVWAPPRADPAANP